MSHHPVDVHVGNKLRERRNFLRISQERLGKDLGLTFQQIQKYEKGANRVGASRLYQISQLLKVPPAFFFDEIPDSLTLNGSQVSDDANTFEQQPVTTRETQQLARAFYSISDVETRKRVLELIKAIGEQEQATSTET
ncbi:hypothetical protein A9Q83_15735 [Alphaproteobacteria bacterium 46_93_T64]|nr:hypothetical protein A9Q83_15735 [Alphaproteobacteria bacterium 46_93_T64]